MRHHLPAAAVPARALAASLAITAAAVATFVGLAVRRRDPPPKPVAAVAWPTEPSTLAPPPPADRAAGVAAAAGDPCAAVERDHLASLGPLQQRARRCLYVVDGDEEGQSLQLASVFRCQATADGAWALRLLSAEMSEDDAGECNELRARYRLERLDARGAPVALDAATARALGLDERGEAGLSTGLGGYTRPLPLELFDWDGDGRPEVVFAVDEFDDEGNGRTTQAHALTVRDGAVTFYEPALAYKGLTATRDVDGDGRPDLVLEGPFRAVSAECGMDGPALIRPLPLAAHSLPDGSFTLRDGVTAAEARRQCEGVPAAPLVARVDHDDGEEDEKRINDYHAVLRLACARVAGRAESDLVRALRAEGCLSFADPEGCDERRPRHVCPTYLKRLATAALPLTF